MKRLENKVAIVTGAASGIGQAIAKLFANEGCKVMLTDVQEEKLKKTTDSISATGAQVTCSLHDVSNETQWKEIIQKTISKYGKIDILVNNAGITGGMADIESTSLEDWNKVQAVNTTSAFLGIKHCLPEFRKNRGGSVVNVSSIAGITGMAGAMPYTASKGALRTWTKGAAVSLAKDKIRVNSIHPGYTETPMIDFVTSNKEALDGALKGVPLACLGTPEDIAYGALYLASDEAKYVTGAELVIDGGYTAI